MCCELLRQPAKKVCGSPKSSQVAFTTVILAVEKPLNRSLHDSVHGTGLQDRKRDV